MTTVHRSALVPYSSDLMYRLVADIDAYPGFLPWCRSVVVHERTEHAVQASIEIARGPVRKTFSTTNEMEPGRAIHMHLLKGPFKSLEGEWGFHPLGDEGSKVTLDMHFEFANPVMRATIGPVFNEIANTLVDAFCQRAHAVYGRARAD